MSELDACAAIVHRNDRDRYLTCLFAGEPQRSDLFALYAFNHEVAKTAEVVSEPLLGEIRLQWWRERIDEIYDSEPRRHEVVEPLATAVRRCGLRREDFHALLDGRAFDLQPEPPDSLAALEAYTEATASSLLRLALQVVASPPDAESARHLGIAWGITGLVRAIPFHARQKRLYLPADLMAAAELETSSLFELKSSPALVEVVRHLVESAQQHLELGRRAARHLPRRAIPALLLARTAREHLTSLGRAGYDPFDPALLAPAPGRVWRLAWARLVGRV